MRRLLLIGSLVALLVPAASHAQVDLGLRVGFAPAMGDAAKDDPMSDNIKSQIPIQLDALYRFNKDWSAGAYFSYGIGQLGSAVCPSGASCSANVMRFGVEGTYAFNQVQFALLPWVGAGLGYERGGFSIAGNSGSITGYELNLQAGGDYKVNDQFVVGPYLMLNIGQYQNADFGAGSQSITDKTMHEWFGFGIRGKYSL